MRSQLTFLPNSKHPSTSRVVAYTTDKGAERAARLLLRLGAEDPEQTTLNVAVPGDDGLHIERVDAFAAPVEEVIEGLLADPGSRAVDSVRFWSLATRLAVTAVASQRVLPHLVLGGETDAVITAQWMTELGGDRQYAFAIEQLAAAAPVSAVAIAVDDEHIVDPLRHTTEYVNTVVDALVRQAAPAPSGRPRERLLPWTSRWVEAAGDPDNPVVPLKQDGPELVASIEGWHGRGSEATTLGLVLAAPEDPHGLWTLTYYDVEEGRPGTEPVDDETHVAEAETVNKKEDEDVSPATANDVLLAAISRAARVFSPLDQALENDTLEPIQLDLDQAWTFITRSAPILSASGVDVELPATLDDSGISTQIRLSTNDEGTIDATWEISLDGRVLEDDEIVEFLDADEPLGFYGGRWVRVDEETRRALASRGRHQTISQAEALALALAGTTGDEWFGDGTAAHRVVTDDRLAEVIAALREAGDLEHVAETPKGFNGELRPYQRRGVAWLRGMADLGMGAVLADAMGLGKTIQLIGLLVSRPGPFIVICPTSVVGNWQREINRFAPDLNVVRHHGVDRPDDLAEFEGVLVTSYGTLRRDIDLLETVDWDVVALDEAQQVKNPRTAAAKAVRRLKTNVVFALTGTPLENRLAELWAVIDATNRGLLGSRTTFTKRFVGPVEVRHDAAAATRLRRLVAPFIMRRTKDDPEVAKDLPDKIERTVVAELTAEQRALYEKVSEESLAALAEADGMGRRGRILALLTALKQVVNHPAQYLKEEGPIPGRSGKLALARDVLSAVVDGGDAALVFTQFTRMGDLLATQLGNDFETTIPFLHGGLSLGQRDRMVSEFQQRSSAPILIISTRAGGTGLNLTAASHVLHYDRWWNPAVEDQATDRAHRIGQTQTVEVHKLVTAGTLEERIADMLERKRALADAVVGAGETWLTELDDEALAELVRLSGERSRPVTNEGELR